MCFFAKAQQRKTDTLVANTRSEISANGVLTYTITSAYNQTFCYDIYMNRKIIIKQSSVPGLNGREGFKTKESAEKIAKLVIDKINNGIMPPSITIDELKKLNVLFK